MPDVYDEFNRIASGVKNIQNIFEKMQLTPAEGLAVLAIMRDRTVRGMLKGMGDD